MNLKFKIASQVLMKPDLKGNRIQLVTKQDEREVVVVEVNSAAFPSLKLALSVAKQIGIALNEMEFEL